METTNDSHWMFRYVKETENLPMKKKKPLVF